MQLAFEKRGGDASAVSSESGCCVMTDRRRIARHRRGPFFDRSGQSDIDLEVRLPPVVGTRSRCKAPTEPRADV